MIINRTQENVTRNNGTFVITVIFFFFFLAKGTEGKVVFVKPGRELTNESALERLHSFQYLAAVVTLRSSHRKTQALGQSRLVALSALTRACEQP